MKFIVEFLKNIWATMLTNKQFNMNVSKMVGTEFLYKTRDGDTIPAIIAAFDPKIGFTCLATAMVTGEGVEISDRDLDENGNLCLISYTPKKSNFKKDITHCLNAVKKTGIFDLSAKPEPLPFASGPVCNF